VGLEQDAVDLFEINPFGLVAHGFEQQQREAVCTIEVVNERIRRWKICQKLTEQAEAWAERRRMAMAARQGQHNKFTQGTYVSQT
jgi:hypothetical protein